ncbi:MAG: hypothetical protein M1824_000946 [Vezdaea acicularis]|nr:MAG: hypothetical protein M1824_000946 [Vezdaea acicularis]
MSSYDYYGNEEPPRRVRATRTRAYEDGPLYTEVQEQYSARQPPGQYDLVRRPQPEDSDLSVEEIQRDFPPAGAGAYGYGSRSRPSNVRRASSLDGYGYDGYGAAAGYAGSRRSGYDDDDDYYLDRESRRSRRDGHKKDGRSRSKSRNQQIAAAVGGAALAVAGKEFYDRREGKHQSGQNRILADAALGLGGAAAGALAARQYEKYEDRKDDIEDGGRSSSGKRSKSKRSKSMDIGAALIGPIVGGNDSRSGYGSTSGRSRGSDDRRSRRRGRDDDSRSRSRSRSQDKQERIQQAIKAALTAAAAEGWRTRNEPGGAFSKEKIQRIATAAISAGGIDAFIDRNPEKHGTGQVLSSAIAGLLGNRLINGSRDADLGGVGGRSRSRSRSRGGSSRNGGGGGVDALAGLGLAAAAGKALFEKTRSKSRGRDRSASADSYGGDRRSKRRSQSIGALVERGLSKLGLKDDDHGRSRDIDDDYDRPSRRATYAAGGAGAGAEAGRPRGGGHSSRSSSTSSMSSEEEKRRRRKMKGTEILTGTFATVATVHAAHSLYQTREARNKRHQEVAEGKMSHEESNMKKRQAQLKDIASVGLAVLGIKNAVDEWKETNEKRHETREFYERREQHRQKKERLMRERGNKSETDLSNYPDSRRYDDRDPIPQPAYGGPAYADGNPYAAGGNQYPQPPVYPPNDRRY